MSYRLVANTGDTATADTIKAIADIARRILMDNAGESTTMITITTPTGSQHPFSQRLGRTDLPAEVVAAAADELIYEIRAGLHFEHDEQSS